MHHDGKLERAESRSLVGSNFHCKWFAWSCSTPHYSFALMVHVSFAGLMYFSGTQLFASHAPIQFFPEAFSRSMNTQCNSCCPSLYLSCSCLSATIASVVDFPFTNPNCSSLMLTVFLSRFSCTLSCCDTLFWCPDSFHSSWCLLYSWRWVSRCFFAIYLGSSPHQWSCSMLPSDNSLQFFPNSSTLLSVSRQVQ